MLFFFPFALEPASLSAAHREPLPMLPAPRGGRQAERAPETALDDVIAQASCFAADLLRRALISIMSSLTALGNHANLIFSQAAAALAFDRMARQAASFYGTGWPSLAPYFPQPAWAAGLWLAPFQNPACYSPATIPAWPANLWANPWPALTEAFTAWANIWRSAAAERHPMSNASGEKPPLTSTLSMPGFSWSVTLR